MPRSIKWLMLAILLTAGCKALDRSEPNDRAEATDRRPPPDSGRKPHWLDDSPTAMAANDLPPLPASIGSTPETDPNSPQFDAQSASQGTLSGFVEGPDGNKLRNVSIEVESTDRAGSRPKIVQTDERGYFLVQGLRPNQTYILTANTTSDGAQLAGQIYATPPNVRVRMSLLEGFQPYKPNDSARSDEKPPPVPLSSDNEFPASSGREREPGEWGPSGQPLPKNPPAGGSPTDMPAVPPTGRPDLVTNIPNPGSRPNPERAPEPGNEFALVDTLGRTREFPSGDPQELVLLDFMTTTCLPCKKVTPVLKGLQSRFGPRGLEVIGVVCDEVDLPRRRAVAAAYQRDFDLNYLLYVEPGRRPGQLMDRFEVEWYPTLILLDGTGRTLWKGSSQDLKALEKLLNNQLSR